MKRGLVLGGGGLVGMGYHAGALKALDEFGADLAGSDVIVGTSAGSIIASYLASGWKAGDFFDYAHGIHPNAEKSVDEQYQSVRDLFEPMSRSRSERIRRSVGSMFAVAASRGWLGGPRARIPGPRLRRAFPAGIYSTQRTRQRLYEELPLEWPRDFLYICAADLYTGERVAFGSENAPKAPFPEAVLASTAIPGVFPPVKIAGRQYVDGGIASATSLDLAVEAGCETILCIAPLGYKRDESVRLRDPKMWSPVLMRALFARTLKKEVTQARSKGIEVLVIRPWLSELGAHGTNSMRFFDRALVSEAARQGVWKVLERNADSEVLASFLQKKKARREAG